MRTYTDAGEDGKQREPSHGSGAEDLSATTGAIRRFHNDKMTTARLSLTTLGTDHESPSQAITEILVHPHFAEH